MKTVLSHMILPRAVEQDTRLLYIRASGKAQIGKDKLFLPKGETARFDTYFNAFFYSKYLVYTNVQTADLVVEVGGTCRVELLCTAPDGRTALLEEKEALENRTLIFSAIKLEALPMGGMLFFRITGGVNGAELQRAWWESDCKENNVSLAMIICTYKREEYVRRNMMLLQNTILQSMDTVELFVIDNGRTLGTVEDGKVHVFPNRNCGGSGGFTRGLMEACERGFSHVLFMDDDIHFEPETIFRTVQLLKVARRREKPLMIGGAMLIESEPSVQFESGAFYKNGKLQPVGQGLDISKLENLLENNKERHVQYNAWWYCSFPTALADKIGLPMPFFIKTDDVEYGLRARADILLLNGIGVWHQAFSDKYSPYLEYYIKRNELVVGAIHKNGDGIYQSLRKLIRGTGKACFTHRTNILDYLILSYQDFLKGPDFFLNLDAEQYNNEVRARKKSTAQRFTVLKKLLQIVHIGVQVTVHYQRVKEEYMAKWPELTTYEYWRNQLNVR